MKIFILFIVVIFYSCNYTRDKLSILNASNYEIFYETIIISKETLKYYQVSGGAKINPNSYSSPIVRGGYKNTIRYNLLENSLDGYLYIVFYNKTDQIFVYKNINNIVNNNNFITIKYHLSELDNINWVIKYESKK